MRDVSLEDEHTTLCLVVLQNPEAVYNLLRKQNHTPFERRLKRLLLAIIKRFDARPYQCTCAVRGCKEPVAFPRWDPESHAITALCRKHGAVYLCSNPNALLAHDLVSYRVVLRAAAIVRRSRPTAFPELVQMVAALKGLPPGDLTEETAGDFLSEPPQLPLAAKDRRLRGELCPIIEEATALQQLDRTP
jgi:hypothetical protein